MFDYGNALYMCSINRCSMPVWFLPTSGCWTKLMTVASIWTAKWQSGTWRWRCVVSSLPGVFGCVFLCTLWAARLCHFFSYFHVPSPHKDGWYLQNYRKCWVGMSLLPLWCTGNGCRQTLQMRYRQSMYYIMLELYIYTQYTALCCAAARYINS